MKEMIQRHKNKPVMNILSTVIFLTIVYLKINDMNMLLMIPIIVSSGILIMGKLTYIYLEVCGFLIIIIIGIGIIAGISTKLIKYYKEYVAEKN